MDAYSAWLARDLKKKIDEKIEGIQNSVIIGSAQDYPQYKWLAGQIGAYRQVLDWIDGARLDERGRK